MSARIDAVRDALRATGYVTNSQAYELAEAVMPLLAAPGADAAAPAAQPEALVEKTALSSFVRDASTWQKEAVYSRVIQQATADQKATLSADRPEPVVKQSLTTAPASTCKPALQVQPEAAAVPAGSLQRFLDAAAGEGYVLDGVDAADLYTELFGDEPIGAQEFIYKWHHSEAPTAPAVAVPLLTDDEARKLLTVRVPVGGNYYLAVVRAVEAAVRAACGVGS